MLNLSMVEPDNILRPRISVVGVGGAGGNAINNMIRSSLEGCDFIAANTDSQALAMSLAPRKLQLGVNLSRGLGAGSKPDIGRAAAEEQIVDIMSLLDGSDMLFVTAGMGGGTGTGAAPVIARAARESGILTVGVVTKPFHFEGANRMKQAEAGIAELQQFVDTLIVIPNQNLFRIANERTTFAEAFRLADEVLHSGVRGITDLMVMPGFMNLDFADVKTVMGEMGKAMMGTGEADGDNRAIRAAEAAISNPLLDDISMKGARGVLINVTGGMDMTLFEMDQAANRIREEVDPDAQIKVGSTIGDDLNGKIRVSVIATGIDAAVAEQQKQRASSGGKHPSSPIRIVTDSAPPAARTVTPVATKPVTPAPPAAQPVISPAQPSSNVSIVSNYFTMPPSITPQALAQQQAAPARAETSVELSKDASTSAAESASSEPAETPSLSSSVTKTLESSPPSPSPTTTVAPPAYAQARAQTLSPLRANATPSQAQQQPTQLRPVTTASVTPPTVQRRDPESPSSDLRVTQLTSGGNGQPVTSASQRSQSLFQRITGFGMVRPSREDDDFDMSSSSASASTPAPSPASSSPRVEDLAPPASEAQDLLDIPAFLRRQTNH